jgi:hypothetical protein
MSKTGHRSQPAPARQIPAAACTSRTASQRTAGSRLGQRSAFSIFASSSWLRQTLRARACCEYPRPVRHPRSSAPNRASAEASGVSGRGRLPMAPPWLQAIQGPANVLADVLPHDTQRTCELVLNLAGIFPWLSAQRSAMLRSASSSSVVRLGPSRVLSLPFHPALTGHDIQVVTTCL